MINFRYHLASLVAVFLALAVGVIMGSTVVDRAIVSSLRSRIDSVEANAERRKAENDQLRTDLSRIQGSVETIAPYAVAGRLTGVTVAVVAPRGIDATPVQQTVALLQQAGAKAPGILWLEAAWDLSSRDDITKVANALNTSARDPKQLRDLASAAITGAVPAPNTAAFLALGTVGVVKYEPVGEAGKTTTIADWGGAGSRLLIVDGPNAKIAAKDWTIGLARAAASARIPTVVAEVYAKTNEAPARGTRLQGVLNASDLGTVSTLDDLDLVEGRIATVLALADISRGQVGHYGYGAGATRGVPELTRS